MTVITASQAPAVERPQGTVQRRRPGRFGPFKASWLTYTILAIVFIISVFPFYWTIVAASTSNTEINHVPPNLIPGPNLFHNFNEAITNVNMAYRDVLVLIIANSLLTIVSHSVAGKGINTCRLELSLSVRKNPFKE